MIPSIGFMPFEIQVPDPIVLDEHVDAELRTIRRAHSVLVLVDRPAARGDQVYIDLATKHDGQLLEQLTTEGLGYPLGEEMIAPELDRKLAGMSAGRTMVLAPVVNGVPLEMEVHVREVLERTPPPDDELAEKLLPAEELDRTFETFVAGLRHAIGVGRRADARAARKRGVEVHLAAMVADRPSEAQLLAWCDQKAAEVRDSPLDLTAEEIEVEVLREFRCSVAVGRLARRAEIHLIVTEADVDAEVAAMRGAYPTKVKKRRGYGRGAGPKMPSRDEVRAELRFWAAFELVQSAATLRTDAGRLVYPEELLKEGDQDL